MSLKIKANTIKFGNNDSVIALKGKDSDITKDYFDKTIETTTILAQSASDKADENATAIAEISAKINSLQSSGLWLYNIDSDGDFTFNSFGSDSVTIDSDGNMMLGGAD